MQPERHQVQNNGAGTGLRTLLENACERFLSLAAT